MKKELLLLVLIPVAMIAGCRRSRLAPQGENALDGTWKVTSYQNLEDDRIYTKSSPGSGLAGQDEDRADIIITLKRDHDILALNGHTVANEVEGLFWIKPGDSLLCKSFGGTKIGEPNWGSWFWDAMYSADTYRLQGNTLTIDYHSRDPRQGQWRVTLQRE